MEAKKQLLSGIGKACSPQAMANSEDVQQVFKRQARYGSFRSPTGRKSYSFLGLRYEPDCAIGREGTWVCRFESYHRSYDVAK